MKIASADIPDLCLTISSWFFRLFLNHASLLWDNLKKNTNKINKQMSLSI